MSKSDTIAAVYVSDARYHELTEFSIGSLIANQPSRLVVYFFQIGYNKAPQQSLLALAKSHATSLMTMSIERSDVESAAFNDAALHPHISDVTLYKAHAIDRVAEKWDRIVFLDSDVLALPGLDLRKAFDFDTTLAGVYDFVSYMPFDGQDLIGHTSRTGVSSEYFNAGVLFIRSDLWKSRRYLDRFINNLTAHAAHCPYRHDASGRDPGDCKGADQCALNMSAQDDWTPLEFKWNVQKTVRHTSTWRTAVLRHYTGHRKFLSHSNINRDIKEFLQIRRLTNDFRFLLSEPIKYDFGAMYAADAVKYFRERQGYKRILTRLSKRKSALAAARQRQ